jgi:hypothetical protein
VTAQKLGPAKKAALEAIASGEGTAGVSRRTMIALWRGRLVEFEVDETGVLESAAVRLTKHGKLALEKGRLMLSGRRGP